MIPRTRLIVWTAAVGLPAMLLGSLAAEARPVGYGLVALLAVVAVVDAMISRGRLNGVKVQFPPVTRIPKDEAGLVEIEITDPLARGRLVRMGLKSPPALTFEPEEMSVLLASTTPVSRVPWRCLGRERGQFPLDRIYLETSSRLHLWGIRRMVPIHGEIRVYPNMRQERKNVAALFLSRGRAGMRVRRASGRGREFEKLRDYVPGDGYDEVHWRASAKRGHPVTKVFQVERTQEVYVVLDASRLSGRRLAGVDTVLEHFMTAGLTLALAAQQQGDLFGLLTFSDRIERFVRARSGQNHYAACRDALYTLQPRAVSPNFEELATFIRLRLRKRALLVILTALDDPVLAEGFEKSAALFARQHLVLVNVLQPPGVRPVFSEPAPTTLEGIYENLSGHLLWQDQDELARRLRRHGIALRPLTQATLAARLVSQYLDVKGRQVL